MSVALSFLFTFSSFNTMGPGPLEWDGHAPGGGIWIGNWVEMVVGPT